MARFLNRLLSIALGLSMVNIPIEVQADTYTRSVQAFTKGKVQTSNSSKADKLFMEGNRLLEESKGEIEQRQALTKLYKALELFQSVNNKELEQVALYWIVVTHKLLNDKMQAEKYISKYNANVLDRYNRYRTSPQAIRSRNDRFGNKSLGIYATYFQPRYYPGYNEQLLNNTIKKIKNGDAKILSEALEFLMPRTNSDYQIALNRLQEALKLYQVEKNEEGEFKTLQSIATAYKKLGELQQQSTLPNPHRKTPNLSWNRSSQSQPQAMIPNSGRKSSNLSRNRSSQPQSQSRLPDPTEYLPQRKQKKYVELEKHQQAQAQAQTPNFSKNDELSGSGIMFYGVQVFIFMRVEKFIELGNYRQAFSDINQLILNSKNNSQKNFFYEFLERLNLKLGLYEVYNQYDPSIANIMLPDKNMAIPLSEGMKQYSLGEYKEALNYFNQYETIKLSKFPKTDTNSCDIRKSVPESSIRAGNLLIYMGTADPILIYMGDAYEKLGDNHNAIIHYKNALTIAECTKKNQDLITKNYYPSNNPIEFNPEYYKRFKFSDGTIFNNLELELMQIRQDLAKARNICIIGKIYRRLKDNKQALTYLSKALSIYQSKGDEVDQTDVLTELALIYRSENKLNKALTEIDKALEITESTRSKLTSPDLRTSYFALVQKYYRLKIDLLMQLHQQEPNKGYDIRAIEASENARARGLLDLLIEAKTDIKQGVDPKLLVEERNLQSKIDAVEVKRVDILSKKATIPSELEREYTDLNQQYAQNKDRIRLASPSYAAITQPKPLKFTQIQQLLDDNTILLEYSLGENQSYLWLVTKNRIDSYQLPKSAEIKKIVDKYRPILTRKSGYTTAKIQIDKIAPQLKAILPDVVANKLTNKRLVVVADGALQYLPFGSLPTGADNQPLLLTNEVINLPSASTLGILREQNLRSQASKTVAVFADPVFTSDDERIAKIKLAKTNELTTDSKSLQRAATENGIKFSRLVNTKNEAEAILKLVPLDRGKLNLDFAANLVNATRSDLANYRIVHFATHGLMDGLDPTRSGVVLSLFNERGIAENGYLRLQNIFNLKLDADLVVLSACKTGIGKEIQGEGLVGLTRGFMYAGTPRVVVSLWSVDDEATSILMSNFYTGILKQGLTPAAALRQAQQTMMRDPKYQSPYYWAAFTLQGEWK